MALRPQELRARADQLEEDNLRLARAVGPILSRIDKQVEKRGRAELIVHDTSEEIIKLVAEAKRKGAPLDMLAAHVKRMDKKERKLRQVSRQAIDLMMRKIDGRDPMTTRESRRQRSERRQPAGRLNTDALK